uniref:Uncharacterized protein n=1 Tax=Cucumis melo TaxID=3656 RepID=A0A9I9ELZ3_CUCME
MSSFSLTHITPRNSILLWQFHFNLFYSGDSIATIRRPMKTLQLGKEKEKGKMGKKREKEN